MFRLALALAAVLTELPSAASAYSVSSLQMEAFRKLCMSYIGTAPPDNLDSDDFNHLVNKLATSIGDRLTRSGAAAVPAEDLALLALIVAAGEQHRIEPPQSLQPALTGQPPGLADLTQEIGPPDASEYSDINKGEEGFRQGVERLGGMPLSERMVITGDVTAGIQAASVPLGNDLTSTFGRVRLNVVARAVPESPSGRLSEGYFFLQLRAAGGPFSSFPVGGPNSFTAFNDVATDRSRFNEGTSRGNLYLSKAFYQQEMRLGENRMVGRIGIINLSDFFDTNEFANNEARQFLNAAMVNSAAYKGGLSAPGLVGEYHRRMRLHWLTGAVLRAGYAISRTERAFTSPVWSSELELQTRVNDRQGHWRFGGTVGNLAGIGGLQGIHISADQWLSRSIGVFGRYGFSNQGAGSLALGAVRQSYSAGIQWRFVDVDDRVSALGIGFSQAFPIPAEDPLASERVLETYYRWQLTDKFSLSPDFQLVSGSGGRRRQGLQAVVGMRMNFGL